MIRVCAWCNTVLGETPDEPLDGKTHTICYNCWDNVLFQAGVPLEDYLDSLPVPVVQVDADGKVVGANGIAQRMVGKTLDHIAGRKGGDVFECRFARLPEGCGHTTHCTGCTVRRAVMATHETGESLYRIPAWLDIGEIDAYQKVHFRISTRKVDNVVLLEVEMAEDSELAPA